METPAAAAVTGQGPGPGTAPGPAPDPRTLYLRATAQLASLAATVRPAQLAGPTPCEEYDVRGLLRHVLGGTQRVARLGEGGAGTDVAPSVSGVPDEGWTAAYAEARERFSAAWADDAKLDEVVSVPWGEVPGRLALAGSVMETVTHTWDLAQALGRREELDQELGTFALGTARQAVSAERRGEGVPFAPVRPAPEGTGVHGELAAWLGRRADWADGARG